MKKVFLLVAMFLGTAAMVNAQTEPAKAAPAKEVKAVKKAKKAEKKAAKAEVKADAKMDAAKATPAKK